ATTDEVQLFFFSAATYNAHRIHYDYKFATGPEGHRDILVHGPLQAAFMAKALAHWGGPRSQLVRFAIQNRANAFPHEELFYKATVTAKREQDGHGLIDLDIREENSRGEVLMPGTATLKL